MKPLFDSVMYSPKARTRSDLNHIPASCPREKTSSCRRSQTCARVGQVRMACWKDSGPILHRGEVSSGFSSNHEGLEAR